MRNNDITWHYEVTGHAKAGNITHTFNNAANALFTARRMVRRGFDNVCISVTIEDDNDE